jgi:hypothetical protein
MVPGGDHEVVGTYRFQLGLSFRLFRNQGKNYWPQGSPDFDPKRKIWRCRVHIGGTPGEEHTVIVAAVNPDLRDLVEQYRRVHEKTKQWIPILMHRFPSGITELDRVSVRQRP